MERSVQIFDSHEEAERAENEYWWAQTPAERLRQLLLLRRINYGSDRVSSRLQRVLEIAPGPRNRENAERIVACLKEFGFDLPELTPDVFLEPDRVVRMGNAPVRIEILTDIDGVVFDECRPRAIVHDLEGDDVRVISLEDLKRNKRACGRPKDLDDLSHLP